jgi:hypothetical protein
MHGGAMPLVKVVENHNLMPLGDKLFRGYAADVSGAACNENFHKDFIVI